MIQGSVKTEKQYREMGLDSSSSLKEFSIDRKKYKKRYVDGIKDEDQEDSKASIIGVLVEILLFEPKRFDEKFYMSSLAKAPTGKMLDFCNALIDITLNNTDEEGKITKSFEEMATEARLIAQFEWKLAVILDKFVGKDPEIYYKEVREVKSKGLIVVTTDDVQNAERIVQELKSNDTTTHILNLENSDRYTVFTQYQIDGFDVDGLPIKSMMDWVVIDHKLKTIQVYDLKVTFSVEGFYEEYYLYRRAYIQAYIYKEACKEIKSREGLEHYTVLDPKFIVSDSINYYNPLIYTLNSDDMQDAYLGFEYKGRKYPGVQTIIKDLIWTKETGKWNISRTNYLNGGVVNIKGG